MRRVKLSHALIGCFATCSAYAALLSSKRGQEITLDYTWLTVIGGVSIVEGWTGTQGKHSVWVDFLFFAAGGLPMVVRSWLLDLQFRNEHMDYLRKQRRGG